MIDAKIDLGMAKRFLDALECLDPELGWAFVCWPESEGAKREVELGKEKRARVFRGSFEQHKNALAFYNSKGWHVAVKVNIFRPGPTILSKKELDGLNEKDRESYYRKKRLGRDNVIGYRAVVLDDDSGFHKLEDVKGWGPDIIIKTFKGFHGYWLLSESDRVVPVKKYEYVLKAIATKFGTDHQLSSAKNLRVPGFVYHKNSEGFVSTLSYVNPDITGWTINSLINFFRLQSYDEWLNESEGRRESLKSWWNKKSDEDKRSWVYEKVMEWEGPAVSGSGGNDSFLKVTGIIYDKLGHTEDGFDVLRRWNDRCSPPWSENELRSKWESRKNSLGKGGR